MSIIIEVTKKLHLYEEFYTPSGRSKFKIYHINADRVLIQTQRGSIITIPASCFDGTLNFLKGKGWVKIGAKHDIADEGTLDEFLKRFTHGTSVASYVAPILERIGIVEIDRRRPAKIKLRSYNFNSL